jgi:hypothetical protein
MHVHLHTYMHVCMFVCIKMLTCMFPTHGAEVELDKAVTLFGQTFGQIESVLAPGREYLGNQGLVIGVAVSIWAFAAVAIFLGTFTRPHVFPAIGFQARLYRRAYIMWPVLRLGVGGAE